MIEFYVYSVFIATALMVVAIYLRPHAVQKGEDLQIFLALCLISPVGAALGIAVIVDQVMWKFGR